MYMSENEIDPVCGMYVDKRQATFRSSFRERTYYFCSLPCKTQFEQDPAKYLGRIHESAGPHTGHHCC